KPIRSYVALRKPQKNVEAVESLIRNPSQKSFFFAFENQKVTRNLLFPVGKQIFPSLSSGCLLIFYKYFMPAEWFSGNYTIFANRI
ncbi:MAG: hypothetical protein IJ647_10135, partial [Prevotella sp.]|nr:hypothetical protein [Prevotella sp.]